MLKMKKVLMVLLGAVVLFAACDRTKKSTTETPKATVVLPAFDHDSAYAYVKAQTDFGPRVLGTEAHERCGDWLATTLRAFCDTVYSQHFTAKTYDGKQYPGTNFIGSIAPEKSKRIVLAAHWDSRPFADHDPLPANRETPIDGANDGASGVGVLLEVARQLHDNQPNVGVDIVFFDAEDYGPRESEHIPGDWWGLGAQHWAKTPHIEGYTAEYGILLDMVGSPNAQFMQEQFSMRDAQEVVRKVWSTAYDLGHGQYFQNKPGGVITDDHYYVNKYAPFKMIDIIHYDAASGTGFDPVWHTVNDNIQHIDRNTLGVVGTTLLQVIKNE
jgi:hypothetical protein